ncbi:MAG: MFS transporter [Bifidobacterium crudilactis]|jgi:MFS family permease|nr:MFS transporter [Bifidobacterium crudilactis]
MKTSHYGWAMKFSLLSISMLLTSYNAIAGAMPALIKQFPEQSRTNVELLTTAPTCAMIVMIIVSGLLAKSVSDRTLVVTGISIATVFGIIPFFLTNNFWLIMASRIGLGIGLGLINSLAVSLIGKYFSGEERATLMGFRSAFVALGQATLTLIAGFLLNFGWHGPFLLYILAIPVLILFVVFVPKEPVERTSDAVSDPGDKQRVNAPVLAITAFLFFTVTMYSGVTVRLSSVITASGFGTMQQASTLLSVMVFCGMLMGFVFGKVHRLLKRQTLDARRGLPHRSMLPDLFRPELPRTVRRSIARGPGLSDDDCLLLQQNQRGLSSAFTEPVHLRWCWSAATSAFSPHRTCSSSPPCSSPPKSCNRPSWSMASR